MAITIRTAREALGTAAEIAALGHSVSDVTLVEIVDHATNAPTGRTFLSGSVGEEPTEIATTQTVAQATAATVTPASLTGSGAIALTQATHSGKAWHAEPGTTALTVDAAGWPSSGGGELSIINHTGGDLPIQVGTGMTGYDNARGGRNVPGAASPATVLTLAYLERATIQVKEGMYCNIAVAGGGTPERAWAANTYYRAGEIVRATAAQGTIGVGDRIARTAAGTSRATLDATEAALWAELGEDPDALLKSNLSDTAAAALGTAAAGTSTNVSRSDHVHALPAAATTSVAGLMSSADKTKLDGVATSAAAVATTGTPAMNGAAAVGTSTTAARSDHVHASDTSRSPLASPTFAGTPAAPTASADTNTTQVATTAFVVGQAGATAPVMNGAATVGTSLRYSRQDHVHATDTSRQAALVSGTNIKTVNGASLLGSGDVVVSAGLPGGSAQTANDDGLAAGTAVIDRATVAGQTILNYNTVGTTTFTVPNNVTAIEWLAVAGGGGGGNNHGGAGGAGEYRYVASHAVTPGETITVIVGAGGATQTTNSAVGNSGGDTTFDSIVLNGGGGGGGRDGGGGATGGSGGGGCGGSTAGPATAGTSTLTGGGLGNAGGAGITTTGLTGGGGGGSGGVGTAGTATTSGIGGIGTDATITGATVHYAAGGTGGAYPTGGSAVGATRTGAGAGASADNVAGGAATANTGSGGGGGGPAFGDGGAGGSGRVVVRFATQTRSYQGFSSYASNAAAVTGGLLVGEFFVNSSTAAMQQVV